MKIIEMKKISILIIAICFGGMLKAQQLPQVTQYMINNYAINPAVSGMYDYYQVKTTIRSQWAGITDAPRTTLLSIFGSKSEHVGLGGLVFNDQTGPTSRIGCSASYTYSFPITKAVKMSFALSGGFSQYSLDVAGLNYVEGDPLVGGDINRSTPDATFGFNTHGKNWYIGVAIPQLLSADLNLKGDFINPVNNNNTVSDGKLARHTYVLGAYKLDVNPSWSIEPSFFLKSVEAAPLQTDFGIKTTIYDLFLGMGYRNNGDMTALFGYSIQDRYIIGYSYDMLSSNLSNVSTGSHEFMIGIRFVAANESEIMR